MKKKYTQYDAIEFAEDPSFIKWVRHKEPTSTQFWQDWQQQHPDKVSVIKEATVLVQAIQIKEEEPTQARMERLWKKIDTAVEQGLPTAAVPATEVPVVAMPTKEVPVRYLRWLGYVAAAAVATLLIFQVYTPTTNVLNGKGAHLVYQLPDNSKVELNADSKIAFKEKKWSTERVVQLEGEAFFEVEKGATFKVITPNGEVTVLGTSFNVNARDGNLVVACKTGKVQVSAKGDTEVLTPGKGTRLNDAKTGLVDTYAANVEQQVAWKEGQFYFKNVSLQRVVEELERQYDIQITADPALLQKVGDYNFKGAVESALKDVCFQLNATSSIKGKQVEIKQ